MTNLPVKNDHHTADKKKETFIMYPIVDFCFKELMRNEKARKGLIAAFINIRPEEILETVLLNTNLRKEFQEEKLGILDVRVLMHDKSQIDLEMQVLAFPFWEERTLFYICKMYAEQIERGEDYDVLAKCIHISILNFPFLKDTQEYYSCFHLRDDKNGNIYSDKLEFHVLELPKIKPDQEPESELVQWGKFLNGKREEDFKAMAEKNEYIHEAYEILKRMSADKEKRLEYETREKAIRDHNHLMHMAKKEGINQGIEALILDNLEEQKTEDQILIKLMKRFSLSQKEAEMFYEKYSKFAAIV